MAGTRLCSWIVCRKIRPSGASRRASTCSTATGSGRCSKTSQSVTRSKRASSASSARAASPVDTSAEGNQAAGVRGPLGIHLDAHQASCRPLAVQIGEEMARAATDVEGLGHGERPETLAQGLPLRPVQVGVAEILLGDERRDRAALEGIARPASAGAAGEQRVVRHVARAPRGCATDRTERSALRRQERTSRPRFAVHSRWTVVAPAGRFNADRIGARRAGRRQPVPVKSIVDRISKSFCSASMFGMAG